MRLNLSNELMAGGRMTSQPIKPKSHRWVFHVLGDISEYCEIKSLTDLKTDIDAVIAKHSDLSEQLPSNMDPTENLIQFKRPG